MIKVYNSVRIKSTMTYDTTVLIGDNVETLRTSLELFKFALFSEVSNDARDEMFDAWAKWNRENNVLMLDDYAISLEWLDLEGNEDYKVLAQDGKAYIIRKPCIEFSERF